MNVFNVEIKAKINDTHYHSIKAFLDTHCSTFKGIDRQSDYYFHTPHGRLKLRIGNIEQSLIYYKREEDKHLKTSSIKLYKPIERPSQLLDILKEAYGVKVKVTKERLIYYIDHVKFHLDTIKDLGYFCEIEAISKDHKIPKSELIKSCNHFIEKLKISDDMMIQESYSDMLLNTG